MIASFFTVFVSMFLAELGDKTQLATALYAASGERPMWLVFLASSSALVASAALATVAGSILRDLVSGPWLRLAAGAGFILIGAFIVWGAVRPA
jgi:putative Ca2+/H+ antiporter (TMEM165/GDT1 family)